MIYTNRRERVIFSVKNYCAMIILLLLMFSIAACSSSEDPEKEVNFQSMVDVDGVGIGQAKVEIDVKPTAPTNMPIQETANTNILHETPTQTSSPTSSPTVTPTPMPTNTPLSPAPSLTFTGTWDAAQYGIIELSQDGNKVVGTYEYLNQNGNQLGHVEGEIQGNKLELRWWESLDPVVTYEESPTHGFAYFILSEDRNSVKGEWRKESDKEWVGEWNLTRSN